MSECEIHGELEASECHECEWDQLRADLAAARKERDYVHAALTEEAKRNDALRARVAVLEGALMQEHRKLKQVVEFSWGDAKAKADMHFGAESGPLSDANRPSWEWWYFFLDALTPQAQPPAEVRTNPDPLLPGLAVAIRIVAARLRTSRALRYSEVFTAALDEVLVFLRAEEERAIHPETASLTTTCTAQPAQGVAGNGDGREHMLTCASQRNFGKRGPCDCIEPDPDTLPTISRRQVEELIENEEIWARSESGSVVDWVVTVKSIRSALGLTPPAKEGT